MDEGLKKMTVPRFLLLCVQGAIVGTGAILPGVSGGVLMVAFGIYEPLMALLAHPKQNFKKVYKIFIPFLIGWIAGFFLLAKAVTLLFEVSPEIALMLFAGLVLGTVPYLLKKSVKAGGGKNGWIAFAIAFASALILFLMLRGAGTMAIEPNIWWFAFCGAVWGLSLVVPGLSSSSILIFLGLYAPMTAGIASIDLAVCIPLLAGLLATVFSTARLVNSLFEKHYAVMSRVILGIMIAATILIIPTAFPSASVLAVSLLCFAGGFVVAMLMDRARKD